MHTSRYISVVALAAAALAAPAPQGAPAHSFGPSGGFSASAASTGSVTRSFQAPTTRTTAPSKSYSQPSINSTKSASSNTSPQPTISSGTNPSKSSTTSKPSASSASGNTAGTPGRATFSIVNKLGSPVSTSYIANQTPISGPGGPGVIQDGDTSVVVVGLNWSGNIAMSEGAPSGDDSLFEGTFAPNGIDVDVSYVNGYSVPITCSCKPTKVVLSGCNIDLFSYKYPGGKNYECPCNEAAKACPNPVRPSFDFGLTPDPFFQPCEGAAYTWAHDDLANSQGFCESNIIECCIGTDECPTNPAIPKAIATPKAASVISNPSCKK